jgi:hypothetical protein
MPNFDSGFPSIRQDSLDVSGIQTLFGIVAPLGKGIQPAS